MTNRNDSKSDVFWSAKRKMLLFFGLLLTLLGLAVYWQAFWQGGLQELPAKLDHIREQATRVPIWGVLLTITMASIIAIPLGAIIVAGSVIFGPWLGGLYVVTGALLGALLSFLAGASLGRQVVEELCGPRLKQISERLGERGLLSVIIIRLLPIAPFAIVNMFAGATHIRVRDFALGSFLGMLPGVAILGVGVDQLLAFLR